MERESVTSIHIVLFVVLSCDVVVVFVPFVHVTNLVDLADGVFSDRGVALATYFTDRGLEVLGVILAT